MESLNLGNMLVTTLLVSRQTSEIEILEKRISSSYLVPQVQTTNINGKILCL